MVQIQTKYGIMLYILYKVHIMYLLTRKYILKMYIILKEM